MNQLKRPWERGLLHSIPGPNHYQSQEVVSVRLSQATQLFIAAKDMDGYSPRTISAYQLQFRLLMDAIGDPELTEITTATLRTYLAKNMNRLKPASLGHRIRILHALWRWLIDEEYIDRDPSRRIREPKQGDRIPKALTVDQLEDLRDACRTPREHALLELFFASGARLSEVCSLDREQLQWDRRSVRVIGKGNKEREIYWGAKANRWLVKYLDSRTDDNPALFVTLRKPYRRVHPHTVYHAIKQIAGRAGMYDIVWPHRLRHSLATTLIDNGADLTVVQSILGHEKPSTTLLYAKLSGTRRRMEYDKYFMQ